MKTIVKNKLAGQTKTINLPADASVAETFCAEFLEGEYAIYEKKGESGTDTTEAYLDVSVMVKNDAGVKTYISFAAKANLSEDAIYAALAGSTINGVKADELAIIKLTFNS